MNEERFRERFHRVVGEPPPSDLRQRVLAGLSSPPRPRSLALGPIAATAALLVLGGFVGWRLLDQRHAAGPATPTPQATVVPTATIGALTTCRLPVVVARESGPPEQMVIQAGFLDTGTGRYTPDPSASIAGLPGGGSPATKMKSGAPPAPAFYSQSLQRWLPVDKRSVAPDGRSYVWLQLLPPGSTYATFQKSELHRYDVASSTDRTLWTYAGSIDVVRWDQSGILAHTVPPNGGSLIGWLIDPATGSSTQQASELGAGPMLSPLPGDPMQNGGFASSSFDTEFQGHSIIRLGSRDPGSGELVVYETSPGKRVTIYRGSQGDATGFDPMSGESDATGIWFTDYGGQVLWRWQPDSGLHKVTLGGLPAPISGPSSAVYENAAGPCK